MEERREIQALRKRVKERNAKKFDEVSRPFLILMLATRASWEDTCEARAQEGQRDEERNLPSCKYLYAKCCLQVTNQAKTKKWSIKARRTLSKLPPELFYKLTNKGNAWN